MSGVEDEVLNISRHFSSALLRNRSVVRNALRECEGEDGTYKLLNLVEYLLKLPSVRGSLEEIICHVQLTVDHDSDGSLVAPEEPYGAKMVHFMISKEKYFRSFQCSYYLLYQSFTPTTQHIILQRYTIPKSLETHILKKLNWRTVNQSLLNYLLIELRRDKNDAKFWETITMMIEKPELKEVINNYASLKGNVNNKVMRISSTSGICGEENFTCPSEAALPAISFVEATNEMDSFLQPKRNRRWAALYRTASEGRKAASHLLGLRKNDKGSPLNQHKPELHTEIDRLVDENSLNYNEMADVCLKVVGTEKKLLNTSPGVSTVDPGHHVEATHYEQPFFYKYTELAKQKPNVFAVFKKYHSVLLDNFPENYMTSLEILYQTYPFPIPSKTIEYITAPASYKAVNQRILELLINLIITSSNQDYLLTLVTILERIVGMFESNVVLKRFDDELVYAFAQDFDDAVLKSHRHSSAVTSQVNHRSSVGLDRSHQWVDNSLYRSPPASPVSKTDETSDMFSKPNNLDKLKPKTLTVIKKYYFVLIKNFPKDHMISLERYLSVHQLSDGIIDRIVSADTPYHSNRCLFGYMTFVIIPDHEDSLFTFCNYLETVIGNREMQGVIEQLRNDLVEAVIEDANNSSKSTSHDVHRAQSQESLPSRQHSLPSEYPLSAPSSLSLHHPPHHSLTSQQPMSPHQSFDEDSPPFSEDPQAMQYFEIVQNLVVNMPEDFKKNLECLREHFTDNEVKDILSSPDYMTGNFKIVQFLISHFKRGEELFKLFDILDTIKDAPYLSTVLQGFKKKIKTAMFGQDLDDASPTSETSDVDIPHTQSAAGPERRDKLIALVNKHYSAILKSFPDDFSITRKKIHTYAQETDCLSPNLSSVNPQVYNEVIFNKLINELLSPDEKMTPQNFGFVVFMLVGDTPAVKELQKDLLKLVDRRTADKAKMLYQFALTQRGSFIEATPSFKDDQYVKKEQEISLSSFDDYYDLLLKVNPRFAKDQFIVAFRFEHGDPLTGNLLFHHNEIQMEVLLVHVRNSIATYGTNYFLKLVDILCRQEPYKEIGFHMLDVYHTRGGQGTPNGHYARIGNPLPIEELTRRLEYHSKQLLAGLQYQPPKPLPSNYIPRPDLLDEMVKAVMDGDTGSIDVDLALFSLPGYGKSTLVKALCYHDVIMQYFLDGFLWIKLGLFTINHYSKLTTIYHQLTAMTFTGDQSLLVDKLKNLKLQRLLVIIDDVRKPDDVMLYLEIFRDCKVILLSTRKEELCVSVPIKQTIELGWHNTDIIMCLQLLITHVKGFEDINNELFAQVKGLTVDLLHWPFLLNIIHHQLIVYCNDQKLSPNSALQKILHKLMAAKGSKHAQGSHVEIIIEGSFELLENKDICRLNELVYHGVAEHVTPKYLLPHIWKVNNQVADHCIKSLYSCGLIQYTEKLLLTETTYKSIPCVEVPYLIAQHLLLTQTKQLQHTYDV